MLLRLLLAHLSAGPDVSGHLVNLSRVSVCEREGGGVGERETDVDQWLSQQEKKPHSTDSWAADEVVSHDISSELIIFREARLVSEHTGTHTLIHTHTHTHTHTQTHTQIQ